MFINVININILKLTHKLQKTAYQNMKQKSK